MADPRPPDSRRRGSRATRLRVGKEELVVVSFPAPRSSFVALTPTEQSVLEELLRGRTLAKIGASRGRSPATIRHQVEAIYRKLGVGSRAELVNVCSRVPR